MKEIFINIVFTFVALAFAYYYYKKGKKSGVIGFIAIAVLIAAYTYRLYAGM